jgi:hypothetical protein
LWRDRADVFVGPAGVRATVRRRGLRSPRSPCIEIGCDAADSSVAALPALGDALERLQLHQRAAVHIVMSSHFVRLALVPGGRGLRDEGERTAAARSFLQKRLGGDVSGWRVVLDGVPGDGPAVAAAAPESFIDALNVVAAQRRLTLHSVEPLLCAAIRNCRGAMGREPAWLAVAEPGQLVLAAVVDGNWRVLRNHRLREPLADALPGLLEQAELIDAPTGIRKVVVAMLDLPPVVWPPSDAWDISPVLLDPWASAAAT